MIRLLRLDDNIKLKGDRMSVVKSDTPTQYNDVLDILEQHGFTFNQMFVKECLQALTQTLMDIEVSQMLDASHYERNTTRRAYRNGYRSTVWNSSIGDIELRIPKLRRGTYYPDQLLNDPRISEMLVQLIRVSVLYGIDEGYVAEMLSKLDLIPLSSYEIHQLCDVIRVYVERFDKETESIKEHNRPTERLPINYHRHQLLNRKRLVHEQLEIIDTNEGLRLDSEFWQDFARRLIQAGLIEENHQSMLSGVNPYALLQLDDSESVLHPNFAQYVHPLYENDYQWIA